MLDANYGFIKPEATVTMDLTIGGHPAQYIKYNKNYSRVYFAVDDSIYSISWKGTELTPEIEEIIATSTPTSISSSTFYAKLDAAYNNYQNNQKHVIYDMDPHDDIEDYNEYSAYDVVEI